jgi:hypothetical protein
MSMNPLKTFHAAALAVVFVVSVPAIATADDIFSWVRLDGVCYDYDPYDWYRQYGKYYPYSEAHCHRALRKKHTVVVATSSAGGHCTTTNIRNFKNACNR